MNLKHKFALLPLGGDTAVFWSFVDIENVREEDQWGGGGGQAASDSRSPSRTVVELSNEDKSVDIQWYYY